MLGWRDISGYLFSDQHQINATVGGHAVMNCHLDFPFGNEIPYQLEWDKDVSIFHTSMFPYMYFLTSISLFD